MFENLVSFVENRLSMASKAILASTRLDFLHQAFGAVEFAGGVAESKEAYDAILTKWEKEWFPAFWEIVEEGK